MRPTRRLAAGVGTKDAKIALKPWILERAPHVLWLRGIEYSNQREHCGNDHDRGWVFVRSLISLL
jgi:hypothetical protein